MWFHFTVRTRRAPVPLTEPLLAAAVWKGLRRAFPEVAAAVLMPDHLHFLAWGQSAKPQRSKLARVLSGLTRATGLGVRLPEWEPLGDPPPILGAEKLARQVRYVVLNPCRARLVDDPLRWLWTTHRDVMGGVADPWVTAQALARTLVRSQEGFAAAHHAYVSGDPSVRVEGTPPPRPFSPEPDGHPPSLERLTAAAVAATRAVPEAILRRTPTRRLFLQLAWELGRRETGLLARRCGIFTSSIRRHICMRNDQALAAALVCLGDDRFLSLDWAHKEPPRS